jgi:hypothetical protein
MADKAHLAFAADLSKLCRKHGLALRGSSLFVMGREDFAARYVIEDNEAIVFVRTSGAIPKSDAAQTRMRLQRQFHAMIGSDAN